MFPSPVSKTFRGSYQKKIERSTQYRFDRYTVKDIPKINISYSDDKGLSVFIPARPWYRRVFVDAFFRRAVDYNPYDKMHHKQVYTHKTLEKPTPSGEWVVYMNDYPVESGDIVYVGVTIQPRQDYVLRDNGAIFILKKLTNGTWILSTTNFTSEEYY